ncbi:MAG: ABC transporter permease, partial [Gemmataceae bacterium]|nr:ABC transporter permease [Gemmataceae bacterium]
DNRPQRLNPRGDLRSAEWPGQETRPQRGPQREEATGPPLTVIRPPRGWQLINLRELWQFRELLYFLTWRDVKVRYKQTVLGAAWAILQPALMMVVFTIFFGRLASVPSGGIAYPLFVYAGLLPWTFFATAVASAGNSVVGSERLITKVYFPRLAIPFTSVAAAVVDFLLAFGLLVVLMLCYGVVPSWGLLLVPLFFALIVLVALGVGTLLAALNVAYRDFRYVIPFLIQVWLFATPTVYMDLSGEEPSGPVQALLAANPLRGLVAAFRAAMLGGSIPWGQVAVSAVVVVGLFLAGCLYFRKVEDTFADVI